MDAYSNDTFRNIRVSLDKGWPYIFFGIIDQYYDVGGNHFVTIQDCENGDKLLFGSLGKTGGLCFFGCFNVDEFNKKCTNNQWESIKNSFPVGSLVRVCAKKVRSLNKLGLPVDDKIIYGVFTPPIRMVEEYSKHLERFKPNILSEDELDYFKSFNKSFIYQGKRFKGVVIKEKDSWWFYSKNKKPFSIPKDARLVNCYFGSNLIDGEDVKCFFGGLAGAGDYQFFLFTPEKVKQIGNEGLGQHR